MARAATGKIAGIRREAHGAAVKEVYRLDKGIPQVPTPVVAGDLLFL